MITFGTEKLEWCGYPTVKQFDDMFSRFDTIPSTDGQTDRHTNRHRRKEGNNNNNNNNGFV